MKKISVGVVVFSLTLIFTSCETAFEMDLSNKKVVLLSPVNNLIIADTLHTFYWDRLQGAAQYRLQIVSPKFDSIVRFVRDTTIAFDHFTINLNPAQYQWRVRAINNSSETEPSDIWNLTIQ